jgi:alpha-tubulin suppressor-like RCC1 family protein
MRRSAGIAAAAALRAERIRASVEIQDKCDETSGGSRAVSESPAPSRLSPWPPSCASRASGRDSVCCSTRPCSRDAATYSPSTARSPPLVRSPFQVAMHAIGAVAGSSVPVELVLLPVQVLFRLALCLLPSEQVRLLRANGSLYGVSETVACWVAAESFSISVSAFSSLQEVLAVSAFRALQFVCCREKAIASAQRRELAAGLQHSVVVRGGVAHSWGAATSGQLGRGSPAQRFHPVPTGVRLDTAVISVACGGDHSLLMTACGNVWAFGRNSDGQLGNGCDRDSSRPVQMILPTRAPALQVACGADHSLVLTADSLVYACGRGAEGQLGTLLPDGQEHALYPIPAEDAQPPILGGVCRVVCGADHSLVLGRFGHVYSFGENSKGQLGVGHRSNLCRPTQLALPQAFFVVDADCGGTHTLLVGDDARVFGCGSNDQGQLGCGGSGGRLVAEPVVLRCPIRPSGRSVSRGGVAPCDVVLPIARARRISCGFSHSLLLSGSGNVWVLGFRRRSSEEGGDEEANIAPWRVRGALDQGLADDISAGGGHALCQVGAAIYSLGMSAPSTHYGDAMAVSCQSPTPQQVPL